MEREGINKDKVRQGIAKPWMVWMSSLQPLFSDLLGFRCLEQAQSAQRNRKSQAANKKDRKSKGIISMVLADLLKVWNILANGRA
jgi:hypothetical protein